MNLMDVRLRERLLRKGVITQKQVDEYLAQLPDLEAQSAFIDYEKLFEAEAREEKARGVRTAPVAVPGAIDDLN